MNEEKLKINNEELISKYNSGYSIRALARMFSTYPTTIKRILEKNNVDLRHDRIKKGDFIVKDGEYLISWAKEQNRPVTKMELAAQIGKKRLSPSYFLKYPELGKYITTRIQNDLLEYSNKLYKWLDANNIPYKPNDRTKLHVSIDALLLGDYTGFGIQIQVKPKYMSVKTLNERTQAKLNRAKEAGIILICLTEEDFKNLDKIKDLLKR